MRVTTGQRQLERGGWRGRLAAGHPVSPSHCPEQVGCRGERERKSTSLPCSFALPATAACRPDCVLLRSSDDAVVIAMLRRASPFVGSWVSMISPTPGRCCSPVEGDAMINAP